MQAKYVNGVAESRLIDAHVSMRDRYDYLLTHPFTQHTGNDVIFKLCAAKINFING